MATITVTPIKTFVSGETVTPATLNQLAQSTVALTAGSIVAADIASNAVTTAKILDANVTNAKLASGIDASKLTTGTLPIARIADGGLTAAKLASGVATPAGAVMAFAMNSAPAGWLAANGSNVNRTTYAALFSALGTTYGAGNGSTTFALPDLRGYFVRGVGVAGQNGANSDGTVSGTFGQKQADDLKSHTHTYSDAGVSQTGLTGGPTPFANTGTTSRTTDATGGTETRPKNIAMLYCIKF
jgi:microcystin-dependent protein